MDKAIDLQRFHPERSSITPPPGMEDFSVRWTGFLTPDESGDYQIGNVGSMNRLWLDGKLIVDDFLLHDPKPTKATSTLKKDIATPSNWNTDKEVPASGWYGFASLADPNSNGGRSGKEC